jgi:ElaB/YqjD/DUF883 family membrane-anchored ribosome-binding protein
MFYLPANEIGQLFMAYEENPILREKISVLEQKNANLEKEIDLLKREKEIQGRLTSLVQREAEIYRSAFEREKDLTDRAIKLAETSKGKSNWQLTGLAGAAALLIGFLLGK